MGSILSALELEVKPRKLTKTMKEQIARAKESRAIKSELRRKAAKIPYAGMSLPIQATLYRNDVKSIDTGKHNTSVYSMMNERYNESAEVRAEIERKAMCLAPAYNKGAVQFIGDMESARDAGKKSGV